MVAVSQLHCDSYFSKLSAKTVKVVLGFWDSPATEVDKNVSVSAAKKSHLLHQKLDPKLQKQSIQTHD